MGGYWCIRFMAGRYDALHPGLGEFTGKPPAGSVQAHAYRRTRAIHDHCQFVVVQALPTDQGQQFAIAVAQRAECTRDRLYVADFNLTCRLGDKEREIGVEPLVELLSTPFTAMVGR